MKFPLYRKALLHIYRGVGYRVSVRIRPENDDTVWLWINLIPCMMSRRIDVFVDMGGRF